MNETGTKRPTCSTTTAGFTRLSSLNRLWILGITFLVSITALLVLIFSSSSLDDLTMSQHTTELSTGYPDVSVAFIGFIGREGSSWLIDMLQMTSKVSKTGKICVLGFEPLDYIPKDIDPVSSSVLAKARQDFYVEFAKVDNHNEEAFREWIARLNTILQRGHLAQLKTENICDFTSRVFIFKTRLAIQFAAVPQNAAFSTWMKELADAMMKSNGKVIVLCRQNLLLRAATKNSGQFEMQRATTDEDKEKIKRDNANVVLDLSKTLLEIQGYIRTSTRMLSFVRDLRVSTLVVHYENFLGDGFEREMRSLLRFLEVPIDYKISDLRRMARFEKVSPDRLCKKVANYAAVCHFFRKTEYAGFLDEPCDTPCR